MGKGRPFRVGRESAGGLEPQSFGRKGRTSDLIGWTERIGASGRGAKEVLVKISGGGRDADGVQAHFEYIDRHGKLEIETDDGQVLTGKTAATTLVNEWALDYAKVPGAPHSRGRVGADGERRPPRQAFNIVLSMPVGTPPQKVLQAAKNFAREEFAHQHRYAMTLHAEEDKNGHGRHPHVHVVVKAEHEFGGRRLNPRKADLQRWREQFAGQLVERGVAATATRRDERGLVKTGKKTPIYRATQRDGRSTFNAPASLQTGAGDSTFMRAKLEALKREVLDRGEVSDPHAYRSLLNVRAQVDERYGEAIAWLRSGGREEEARRFELLHRQLPSVRSERQLLGDRLRQAPVAHDLQEDRVERTR